MNLTETPVNSAETVLSRELTLSAVGEPEQQLGGALTELAPPVALVRDERDPYPWTEAELRLAFGDR